MLNRIVHFSTAPRAKHEEDWDEIQVQTLMIPFVAHKEHFSVDPSKHMKYDGHSRAVNAADALNMPEVDFGYVEEIGCQVITPAIIYHGGYGDWVETYRQHLMLYASMAASTLRNKGFMMVNRLQEYLAKAGAGDNVFLFSDPAHSEKVIGPMYLVEFADRVLSRLKEGDKLYVKGIFDYTHRKK